MLEKFVFPCYFYNSSLNITYLGITYYYNSGQKY